MRQFKSYNPANTEEFRMEYYSEEKLQELGGELADILEIEIPDYAQFSFTKRQKKNKKSITSVYLSTFKAAEARELITPAAEWLLDNFYLIDENIRQIKRDLPIKYFNQLPGVKLVGSGKIPQALALARSFALHSHCDVTVSRLNAMINGFQVKRPLLIGELWAIPSLLRFVLIEELRDIALKIRSTREMRERANKDADRLFACESDDAREKILKSCEVCVCDNAFASQLLYRLRESSIGAHDAIEWIEGQLEKLGGNAEEVLIAEHNRLSSANVRIGNIVRSLGIIDGIDWAKWFTQVSKVDALLQDRSNFIELDFNSQDSYRNVIELLARNSNVTELGVTSTALDLCDQECSRFSSSIKCRPPDIGQYFIGDKRTELEKAIKCRVLLRTRITRAYRKLGWLSIALPIIGLTFLVIATVFGVLLKVGLGERTAMILSLLAALPASEAATGLFNTLVTYLKAPTRLIGFEFKDGIPETAKTLVVIPCMISSRDEVDDLIRNLEVHYLSNARGEIYFALASDWGDSNSEISAADEEVLSYAREEMDHLAGKYIQNDKTRFFLLHRTRLFNPSEGIWMGWERKRGKLHELNLLLRGDHDTTFLSTDPGLPTDIQYVMTLDADTRITRDAVTKLVGKMAHPLNEPFIDEKKGRVVSGYAIMQPRVTPSLTTGEEASPFQRIFSQNRGLDPYVFAVSDVYQDLTDEGTFTGKGLYQVDAFNTVLKDQHADNTVLSHDLLESTIARSALVTDIELIEDFPVRYEVECARQHRWARGDWQLLPYIYSLNNGIPALGRWKMFDNLRRTMVPGAWLIASLLGWCVMSLPVAILWQVFLVLSLFISPTLSLIRNIFPGKIEIVPQTHLYAIFSEVMSATAQVLLRIIFIPHSAALMTDAAVRSIFRVYLSQRNLLEWRTAAHMQAASHPTFFGYYRFMRWALLIATLGVVAVFISGGETAPVALLFSFFWASSPFFAWLVSKTAETEDRLEVDDGDRRILRKIARRTWQYFEQFVTEEHNHLPPDNFQEDPVPLVANRTSPTNIGLYLLSIISARDFAWISMNETVSKLEATLATVDKLEKQTGHLYNWYDTKTLLPLHPKYISSVDSGNLAGHLITVSSACKAYAEAPFAHLQAGFEGISDVAEIVLDELRAVPDDRRIIRPLRRRLEELAVSFQQLMVAIAKEPELASIRATDLEVMAADIEILAAELDYEIGSEQSNSLLAWTTILKQTCTINIEDTKFSKSDVELLKDRLEKLMILSRTLAFKMDFAFLMRKDRRLLAIGYRPDEEKLDESCYDLLASEARLTSLFGIAKGDLPTEHWFRLGRTVVHIGLRGALMSWSGSMFEYLMPPLIMQEQHGGILSQSNKLAVKRQIKYGKSRKIPWGISESAFNARDREMNYQYAGFGVPSLGMKRGLGDNRVVAPYATLLASQYQPRAAVKNLKKLEGLGARGVYGFYDAIDFTPSRLPEGTNCVLIRAYMAHHQGMSIVAVSNVIFQGRLRERFHSDPVIEAVELLLQEKAPREVPVLAAKMGASEPVSGRSELPNIATRVIADPETSERSIVLLSDGHYSLMLNATGSGNASWNGLAITRWQPDQVEDVWGTFLFLRDIKTNDWWSATASPRAAPNEIVQTVFSDSKAEFHKTVGTLRSQVDVIVAMESDAEGRQITLENLGAEDRYIEVTSYCEPVISSSDADNAHPAFSKMFIKTEIGNNGSVIYAERNKRQLGEPDMQIAHMVTESAQSERTTQAETDRRKFIGRGRKLSNAAAFDDGATLSGSDGYTLDPILSLRRTVRVPVGKKVKLIFWTIAAPTRIEVEEAANRYIHQESFEREAMHAWTRSQVQLRYIGATPEEAAVFQRLARYLIYPDSGLNRAANVADNSSQSKLWELGISGDCPMLVLRIDAEADIQIVRKALRAQEYYRARGLNVDFIIINEQSTSYAQDLQNTIEIHCDNARRRGVAGDVSEHIFSVRRDLMSKETYNALLSAAWVTLHARNGKFSTQIKRAERLTKNIVETGSAKQKKPVPLSKNTQAVGRDVSVTKVKSDDLEFWNGFGGFDTHNREYVIRLFDDQSTPQPWINVISNKNFGFHISAEGAGFTWSVNSRDYQLTPWTNDPVINRPGETFFIVDRNTQQVFSPLCALDATASSGFEVRHGLGYSRFSRKGRNLDIELTQTVHATDPVKFSRLRVINKSSSPRTFRIYGYVEWVLGNSRTKTAPFIVTNYDSKNGVLTANNGYSIAYPERTAFFACDGTISSVTASRQEFLGKGDVWRPDVVFSGGDMSNATTTNGDPCAAIACDLVVEAGQESDILFLLGDCASHETSSQLAQQHLPTGLDDLLQQTSAYWDGILNTLQIETPDPAMDLIVNTWLPYQSIACRIRARSAFYQASGAFGFRDQLQDTLAYLMHAPELAREQILNAAGRQFPDGDVQHWWLPATGAGVRTNISDDIVWLAYSVFHFINITGDDRILDINLPFLEGASLEPGQHDAFFQPKTSKKKASIYTHCTLALDLAIQRTGAHGLPLILGGDWNDGMNRVGEQGRGESVWLGWFLATALKEFIPLAKKRGDLEHAKSWRAHQLALQKALESAGWDGKYYRRGYFDDGSPLGSVDSDECKIDSISQSWSVLSGLGDSKKIRQAMASVVDQLIDKEAELIKLFTPPFQKTDKEPGYIKGYPPGVRENGGQYTHAATWVVYALAEIGQADEAYDCFKKLNPINHSLDEKSAEIYRVEPYVVAADVYSEGELKGRGGWSWYTGASGWLYRTAVEAILGVRKKGDRLLVNPSLPKTWDGYSAALVLADVTYKIKVSKKTKRSYKVTINGKEIKDAKKGYLLKQKKRQRKKPSTKGST